ncbi:gamma carbonic anhydrase family protein [Phenylobacterium immobile]|uniref:gamma carbonic anhydrase family protein n=1 Tax=Phenylobacterium immobile TaxID=21 RepID=UPI000B0F6046|nr:gamma carbonic anhydrase family protein [Phenylobacterium immobile]
MAVYRLGDATPALPADDDYWIAPNAIVCGRVILGAGATVWFGAVLRGDNDPIVLGAGSNVQDNAVLHTDPGKPLTIAEDVTIGHRAMLHGCTIGAGSLIGMGATILNGAVIGEGCLVGAGALVTEDKVIPEGSLVVGSPGRVIRTLAPEAIARLRTTAHRYVANGRRFRAEFAEI